MKNFKRIVGLLVAIAMCAGLMPTALASNLEDFSDADDVTYVEAMDVLVSIGVISGSDGLLCPQDPFTREQAAKMIAYMLLGEEAAEALSADGSSFSDVSASRWSAGYIEYLAGVGILNGVGDGSFNPSGYVTGNQFVKMLLCAIGYGVQNEFVGTYWETYVESCGEAVGAYSGSGAASYSNAATREEAMLYAFNILTGASLVRYSAYAEAYYTVTPTGGVANVDDDAFYLYTLGYQTFGLYAEEAEEDGVVYRRWFAFDEEITDTYNGDAAVETATLYYNGSFYLYDLYEELGEAYEVVSYTVDGLDVLDALSDTTLDADNDEQIGSGETLTVVLVDETNAEVKLATWYTYLAKITYIYSDTLVLRLYLEDSTGESGYTFAVSDASDYTSGEYVLVMYDYEADAVQAVWTADTLSGVVEAYYDAYVLVEDGLYEFSECLFVNEASEKDDLASTFTFYLNDAGCVIGIVMEEYVAAEDEDEAEETSDEEADEEDTGEDSE